jgi:carbonic anhydrase
MESSYNKLISGNKLYAAQKIFENPDYFAKLSEGQSPDYLWIGCSDSRVPANEITNTGSGEIFVHRNVANLVVHTDMNLLSVLEYAVNYLHVKHIIVCGHYGCGGVIASMSNDLHGFVDNWLCNIKDVYTKHDEELNSMESLNERANRLTELNVMEQVRNLAKTTIVQQAWKNREIEIHGWVYGMANGLIKELCSFNGPQDAMEDIYRYNL